MSEEVDRDANAANWDCRALVHAVAHDPLAAAEMVRDMTQWELIGLALATATRLATAYEALALLGVDPDVIWADPAKYTEED